MCLDHISKLIILFALKYYTNCHLLFKLGLCMCNVIIVRYKPVNYIQIETSTNNRTVLRRNVYYRY